jgi:hypothetical protein
MKKLAVLAVVLALATPLPASAGWLEKLGEGAARTTRNSFEWGYNRGLPAARDTSRRAAEWARTDGIRHAERAAREAGNGAREFSRGWQRGWRR